MEDQELRSGMSLQNTGKLGNNCTDFKDMPENPLLVKKELPEQYECTVCQDTFASENELTKHYKEHMEKNLYMCVSEDNEIDTNIYTQEPESNEWEQSFQVKLFSGDEKQFKCDICQRIFSFKSSLLRHYSVHAEINIDEYSEEQKLSCCLCAKSFLLEEQLRRHYRCHIKPHECDICHKKFPFKSNLLTHYRTHLDKAVHTCPVCFKSFPLRKDLKIHSTIHEECQPLHLIEQNEIRQGNQKEKASSERINIVSLDVDKFVESSTPAEKLQFFECDRCDKAFESKTKLSIHYAVHTRIKRHKCIICLKYFTKTSHLQNHLRIHTGERPYSCDMCPRAFSEKGNLVKHQIRHKKAGYQTRTS